METRRTKLPRFFHPYRKNWDMPHQSRKAYNRQSFKDEMEEMLEEAELDELEQQEEEEPQETTNE